MDECASIQYAARICYTSLNARVVHGHVGLMWVVASSGGAEVWRGEQACAWAWACRVPCVME